ncbi:MAG: GNAT family N-acetyltransferase [Paracoccus sp. (in: a-proteobacteria)]|nr:GNAT family N-acetyltransferase [Paracoccus sp. (in: a-proteobacteria)]
MSALTAHIPVIETERLTLRAPAASDLPAMAAFFRSDRAVHVGGPLEEWEVFSRHSSNIGQWVLRGHGWWTIEDRASQAVAGRCGIGWAPDYPDHELGWQVYDGFEGCGLAFEAANAALTWWIERGNKPPVSLIGPANTRSRRLAERMGAKIERETTMRGQPCLIYRHPEREAA